MTTPELTAAERFEFIINTYHFDQVEIDEFDQTVKNATEGYGYQRVKSFLNHIDNKFWLLPLDIKSFFRYLISNLRERFPD